MRNRDPGIHGRGGCRVDVAESEEPRKSWAIISLFEDEVRGTAVRESAGGADAVDVAGFKEPRK